VGKRRVEVIFKAQCGRKIKRKKNRVCSKSLKVELKVSIGLTAGNAKAALSQ
jgi:hypothetical protein